MNNKSRKAKARYLQNLVKDRIMKLFPSLTKDDIRCAMMSENGADIKLMSLMARKLFPIMLKQRIERILRQSINTINNPPNTEPWSPY